MRKPLLILLLAALSLAGKSQDAVKPSLEKEMIEAGLVCLADVCPDVQVNLVFATTDNPLERALYGDLQTAYLHPSAAQALKKAQAALKRTHPQLSLLVYDAARPMSVQGQLYARVVGTTKNIYISDPRSGGDQHNYGLAVDVTLCDAETGEVLDMGTAYGTLEAASGLAEEEKTDGEGLSEQVVANRKLLRRVMAAGGFKPLRTEWWHFNFRTRSEAKANFSVIK